MYTAEVSQIIVSCESLFNGNNPVYFTLQIHVLYTCCNIHKFTWDPAVTCIPVASMSPVYVPPIQLILKHCGAYT